MMPRMNIEQVAGEGRQPAGVGDQEEGAARDIVNAGGGRASLGRARRGHR